MVQPSLKREGFSSIPNVKWEDVGGLGSVRKEFDRYIVGHIKHPEVYEVFRIILSHLVSSVCVCVSYFENRFHWKLKEVDVRMKDNLYL